MHIQFPGRSQGARHARSVPRPMVLVRYPTKYNYVHVRTCTSSTSDDGNDKEKKVNLDKER